MKLIRFAFALLLLSFAPGLLPAADIPVADLQPAGIPPRDTIRTRREPPPHPAPGLTLHVSPKGNDTWAGTEAKPFSTLERGRDEIRALKAKGGLPAGGVLILVHGGEYPATITFKLSKEDSGTEASPVRYAAAPGESPVFRAGRRITGWRNLTDADAYPLLPQESRDKVWIADLKASGVSTVLPLKLGGFGSGGGFETHPANELFFNGRAMPLARGPNKGFLKIKEVAVPDGTRGYDRHGSRTGSFYYEGELPRKWVDEPDLLLYGYWFWDWADSYERVEKIDPGKHQITLARPWHKYGYSVGAPFYAVNALSELDAPGEWVLDRKKNAILFYPPSDPAGAAIDLSLTAVPMLEMADVSHVTFEGITWDLGSADAIHIDGGDHCILAGCTIKRFAGDGVVIGGSHDSGLLSCDISSMGRGGVILSGGDRRTLEPGRDFVENCDIHDLSRIDHTYTPAIILYGAGNRISHNRLHDIPSSAMRIEGNDQVVEYNEVYNVVTESDDQGGADMFGDPTFRGNIFRFNYWHHIGNWAGTGKAPRCGQAGIRLDDAICGTLIYGNVFERCATANFGAVQIHGGKDNIIGNNLIIDCKAGVSFTPWEPDRWHTYVQEVLARNETGPALYQQRYPEMAAVLDNPNVNHIHHNATLRCTQFLLNPPAVLDASGNDTTLDDNFTMKSAPPVLNVPGLAPLPLGEIGLYTDAWRK